MTLVIENQVPDSFDILQDNDPRGDGPMKLQKQHRPETCGPASLHAALSLLGIDSDMNTAQELLRTAPYPQGTCHNRLAAVMEKYPEIEAHTEPYQGGLAIANIKSPLSSHWGENDGGHFVLILGQRDGLIRYFDPVFGQVFEVNKDEFASYWLNGSNELSEWAVSLKRADQSQSPDFFDAFSVNKPISDAHHFVIKEGTRDDNLRTYFFDEAAPYEWARGNVTESEHRLRDIGFKIVNREPEASAAGPYNLVVTLNNLTIAPHDRVTYIDKQGNKHEWRGAEFIQNEIEKEFQYLLSAQAAQQGNLIVSMGDNNLADFGFFKMQMPDRLQKVSPLVIDVPHAGQHIPDHLIESHKPLGVSNKKDLNHFEAGRPESHVLYDIATPELIASLLENGSYRASYVLYDETSRLVRETNRREGLGFITTHFQDSGNSIPANQHINIYEYMRRAAEHDKYINTVLSALARSKQANGWSAYIGLHSMKPKNTDGSLRADIDILHANSHALADEVNAFFKDHSFRPDEKPLTVHENAAYPLCDDQGEETHFGESVVLGHYMAHQDKVDDGVIIEIRNDHLMDKKTRARIVSLMADLKLRLEQRMPHILGLQNHPNTASDEYAPQYGQ